ncbi:MAG: endonuclease [Moraxellaceae bacterium]|nr:MAG: endonuclease [Moraxellaceae bacterium]
MSITVAIIIGAIMGAVLCYLALSGTRNSTVIREYEQKIQALMLAQQQETQQAVKKSLNTSRATIKGRLAEQLAPLLPEFEYLPSDAKFLGDPVDYVIFNGYTDWRDGNLAAEDIEVILMDIKSGQARLTKGQLAIEQAVKQGRVRFETLRIQIDDELLETEQHSLADRTMQRSRSN